MNKQIYTYMHTCISIAVHFSQMKRGAHLQFLAMDFCIQKSMILEMTEYIVRWRSKALWSVRSAVAIGMEIVRPPWVGILKYLITKWPFGVCCILKVVPMACSVPEDEELESFIDLKIFYSLWYDSCLLRPVGLLVKELVNETLA